MSKLHKRELARQPIILRQSQRRLRAACCEHLERAGVREAETRSLLSVVLSTLQREAREALPAFGQDQAIITRRGRSWTAAFAQDA